MEKMMRAIMQELHTIEERGLSGSNIEFAYRLIDMYKDLKNVEYWEAKMQMEQQEEGYSSRGRRRDSMGRYSRNGGGYSYADGGNGGGGYSRRNSFRSSYDNEQSFGESLEDCVEAMVEKLEDMANDARSPEEREKIQSYIKKIHQIR